MSDKGWHHENVEADVGDSSGEQQLPPEAVLELDHVYEVLGHPRRRYLCYTLLEGTSWSLTELSRKVAAWENDNSIAEVTEPEVESVYVSLFHAHIPKLVEEGVVAFDGDAETITTAEHASQVLHALQGMGASIDSNQESHARGDHS